MKDFFSATWRFFVLILIGIAPFLVLAGIVGWHDVIKIAIYGFFVVLLATVPNGPRIGLYFALIFAVLSGAGAALQNSSIGIAALVGLSATLIPIFGAKGMLQAGIFAAMFFPNTVNPAPQPWSGAQSTSFTFIAAIAGVTLLGGLWGLLIGKTVRDKLPPLPTAPSLPARTAWLGGILAILVASGITYFSVTHFPQAKWAWLLAAIYSMLSATTGATWATSAQMIAGTLVGALVAVLLLFANPPVSVMILTGAVVMCASIALRMSKKPYWLSTSVSTAGVIFLTGSSMDPFLAAEDRLIFTLVGAIIAVLLGGAITVAVRLQERHSTRSELG